MNNLMGIGTDVVQIPRIEKLLKKYGDIFAHKILTNKEFQKFSTLSYKIKANFLAKRFAAKESIAKALGVGISKSCKFKDIEIENLPNGAPIARIRESKIDVLISMSDDYPTATAFAMIRGKVS